MVRSNLEELEALVIAGRGTRLNILHELGLLQVLVKQFLVRLDVVAVSGMLGLVGV